MYKVTIKTELNGFYEKKFLFFKYAKEFAELIRNNNAVDVISLCICNEDNKIVYQI